MNTHDRLIQLAGERERLVAGCETHRAELAAIAQQFRHPLKIADRMMDAIRYLRARPLLLGAVVATLVVVQRRGMWNWVRRGYTLWRAYRALGNAKFGA